MNLNALALGGLTLATTLSLKAAYSYKAIDLSPSGLVNVFDLNDQQLLIGSDANRLPRFAQPDYIYFVLDELHPVHLAAAGYFTFSNGLAPNPVSRGSINRWGHALFSYENGSHYFWKDSKATDLEILGFGDQWFLGKLGEDDTVVGRYANVGLNTAITIRYIAPPKTRYFGFYNMPGKSNRDGTLPNSADRGLLYSNDTFESVDIPNYWYLSSINDLNIALIATIGHPSGRFHLWECGETIPLNIPQAERDMSAFLNNWNEVVVTSGSDAGPALELISLWRGGKVTQLQDEFDFAANHILNIRQVVAFNNLGQLAVIAERSDHVVVPMLLSPSTSLQSPGRLINASIRAHVSPEGNPVIVGAVTTGTPKILLRADGPSLGAFGVTDASSNTNLLVTNSDGSTRFNDDWATSDPEVASLGAATGAFLLPANSEDAALVWTGTDTSFTGLMRGTTGTGLLELFDATGDGASHLINLSGRVVVGGDHGTATLGFVVSEGLPVRVLLRAVGPSLKGLGVTDALADPKIRLRSGNTVIGLNDNWTHRTAEGIAADYNQEAFDTAKRVGAFDLDLGSKDAVLFASLPAGAYTAEVSSADGSEGTVLIEVYLLPPATDLIPDMVPI